jgi:hypothetical protein
MSGFEITIAISFTLFSGAWIVFGVGWIRKAANSLSGASRVLK